MLALEILKPGGEVALPTIDERAPLVIDACRAVVIANNEDLLAADAIYQELSRWGEYLFEKRDPLRESAYETYQMALKNLNVPLNAIKEGQKILKQTMGDYKVNLERQRIEAERKANEEQKKREEDERLAAAAALESQGETEAAEQVLDTQTYTPPVKIAPLAPKTATRFQTRWGARVTDIKALCRAVADGKASPEFVTANMVALNRAACAMKQTMVIPGVVAESKTV